MLRLTLIVLAFGFGQLIAASPQLEKRNVTSTSAAGWEYEMYDFGCEITPKKKDGKCWTMCEDSDAIKNPKWCYTGTHPKSPNPVICNHVAKGEKFPCHPDMPCVSICRKGHYPEGLRGTQTKPIPW